MKKCFSLILVLQLFVLPVSAKEVILGGDTIGIQIEFDGVLVNSTYTVHVNNQTYDPMQDDILPGDLITAVNGQEVASIEELSTELRKYPEQEVSLTLKRNNQILQRTLFVQMVNDQIRSGLFVKDEILGIGTLTYVDPQDNSFASLGHEVLENDTQMLIPLHEGSLYEASVTGIRKGQNHQPGEKMAAINFSSQIGEITKNNAFGIYGTIKNFDEGKLIETAVQSELVLGQALMYTVLENDIVEPITINITLIHYQHEKDIKSFEFIVTDEKCLEKSNGIIQGMSGSPIVQNDKLIGAVTHVSSSQPDHGYGIFIEWMLEESESDIIRQ